MPTEFPYDVFLSNNSKDKLKVCKLAEHRRAAEPFRKATNQRPSQMAVACPL
jgi:hypothetical protein